MKKFFTAHIALFLILSLYLNGQKSFYISNSDLAKIEQKVWAVLSKNGTITEQGKKYYEGDYI